MELRINSAERLEPSVPDGMKASGSNTAFFQSLWKDRLQVPCARLLLVGGSYRADMVIRESQAFLRLDQTPGHWSHAAVILHMPQDPAKVGEAIGAEVTLRPDDPDTQVPERNGVTLFRLKKYLQRQFRNICYAEIPFVPPHKVKDKHDPLREQLTPTPAERAAALESAALNPNRGRSRYPLWEYLGAWALYTHMPAQTPNPLVEGTPWPGAALCQYAFEAADVQIAPGASAPNISPEHLWSGLLYWYERMQEGTEQPTQGQASGVRRERTSDDDTVGQPKVWALVRDPDARRSSAPPVVMAKRAAQGAAPRAATHLEGDYARMRGPDGGPAPKPKLRRS